MDIANKYAELYEEAEKDELKDQEWDEFYYLMDSIYQFMEIANMGDYYLEEFLNLLGIKLESNTEGDNDKTDGGKIDFVKLDQVILTNLEGWVFEERF